MKTLLKKLRSNKGFSLLEGVLSTALIGMLMTGATLVMQNSTLNTMNGDMNTIATQLANEKLENIIADKEFLGYAHLDQSTNYPDETMSGVYQGYERSVDIYEVDPADLTTPMIGSGIKRVEVKVIWGTEAYQKVKISTVFSELS